MRRRNIVLIAAAVVILAFVGAGAAWWVVNRKTADVHNGAKLPFTLTTDSTAPTSTGTGTSSPRQREVGPSWPVYGLSDARTRDAAGLADIHPPYHVQWSAPVGFLEYPPVYAKGVLYLYANGGFVSARNVFTGKLLWSRRLLQTPSNLGQGSPAVHAGVVYLAPATGTSTRCPPRRARPSGTRTSAPRWSRPRRSTRATCTWPTSRGRCGRSRSRPARSCGRTTPAGR